MTQYHSSSVAKSSSAVTSVRVSPRSAGVADVARATSAVSSTKSTSSSAKPRRRRPRPRPALLVPLVIGLAIIGWTQFAPWLGGHLNPFISLSGKVETWAAITVAISLQSLPFLILGVLLSASIAAFMPVGFIRRLTPKNRYLAVPATTCAAIALPGCECASVPVARSLLKNGLRPAAALTFMLASPAINPVVIVSTAVAFYGRPSMALARFIASFLAVIIAGWVWIYVGNNAALKKIRKEGRDEALPRIQRWTQFRDEFVTDLCQAGAFLVLGAMIAALVKVAIPITWFTTISEKPFVALLVMAAFAIMLSLCSEADAFVAASFTGVSPTAQLVFLVVGPMIDFKLISMQIGAFGAKFTAKFVPIVLVCAFCSAGIVGALIL